MQVTSYSLSSDDYREVYGRYNIRKALPWALIIGALISIGQISGDPCGCDRPSMADILDGVVAGYGITAVAFLAIYILNQNTAKKVHRGFQRYAADQQFGWDDEALMVSSAFANARYPFALIDRFVETKNLLVVYVTPMAPVILPKRFLSSEQVDELRAQLSRDHSDQSSPMSS